MNLKKIIGNQAHWTLNKVLVRKLGLTETLILQHFIDLETNVFDGEFFQQRERIQQELGLSEWIVKTALKNLKDSEVINVIKKGMPYKNYYSVNHSKVIEILNDKHLQQDGRIPPNKSEVNSVNENLPIQSVEILPSSEEDSSQQESRIPTSIEKKQEENKQEKELNKNTSSNSTGIIEKILDKCINTELEYKKWFQAMEDLNDFGIDSISEQLNWDNDIKKNWIKRINNTAVIYNQKKI